MARLSLLPHPAFPGITLLVIATQQNPAIAESIQPAVGKLSLKPVRLNRNNLIVSL
ncbi:MAG: hypothetical protein NW224_13990 [Leptolyngbyaceae cyanobacterium bins.302]|nr:hypothetical protein [Leptolyngbyaceae cyanobacterium bins.302]